MTTPDLTHATEVRTPCGWYDVISINATTVTVAADFWPIRIPKDRILETK
jgi:hypothetical protein